MDRLATALLPLVLAAAFAACEPPGDWTGDEPLSRVRDTLAEDTAVGPGYDPGIAVPDVEPGSETPEAGDDVERLPAWTSGEMRWSPEGRPSVPTTVTDVRHARRDGFDRWALEFEDGSLPGYRVRYVDRPLTECGSGRQVHPVGEGWLELRLEPARAHTDEGRPTVALEAETPDLGQGLRVYRTCDFEGVLTLVLAVRSPEPFRAFHLADPARVVVDVRH